ncbi:SepM family pheromone-processing serine protease [uncultured Vagococcus sp.]|uniref:SepM family pheromone-processing serine protease n=1 Tax=uncultured Vagococcus sp. TaxID=189676 RepID=UPI0028D814D0|nr:SepM family pheromone-processing serine protease [uncultured Vagococcus sp.]
MKKKVIIGTIGVLLVFVVIFWRTPMLIRGPGNLVSLEKAVQVNHEKDQNKGRFYVTVVQTRSATLWEMIRTFNDPFREVVNQETANNGLPTEASRLLQRNAMNTSQNAAKKLALDLAGKQGELAYEGIFILTASKESGLQGKIMTGDQVITVDDYFFNQSSDMLTYLQNRAIGDEVVLEIKREGTKKIVTGTVDLNENTGRHSLGIQFLDRTELISEIPVDIDLGAVGGPSAGLMFTLQMYTMASNHDLRQGRNIAGTGAITLDGQVTRVGGIAEKVYSAANGGAVAFLVPDDPISEEFREYFPEAQSNYQEAIEANKKLETEMVIVPVKRVQEAIDWLSKTGNK